MQVEHCRTPGEEERNFVQRARLWGGWCAYRDGGCKYAIETAVSMVNCVGELKNIDMVLRLGKLSSPSEGMYFSGSLHLWVLCHEFELKEISYTLMHVKETNRRSSYSKCLPRLGSNGVQCMRQRAPISFV